MADNLWAPWRMEYVQSLKSGEGCIFCNKSPKSSDRDKLIIYRGENVFVLMNLYPYNNGHILVAPYQHVADFDALESETQLEMMKMITTGMGIMRENFRAGGFNFGANQGAAAGAGIEEHLHLHLVPRWQGDTNFMPVLGHTKVMVQTLTETRDTLAEAYTKLLG